ncbi:hypothetical protein CS0771_45160 [Catellatospora sp. IY07-71]|nr:hypothetical protein CS0771_45160 [Catellatospora sp. IY07-71]
MSGCSHRGDWVEPQVIDTGCCEDSRRRIRLTGPDHDRSQVRLAGLLKNPAAPAEVLVAINILRPSRRWSPS